MTIVIAVAFEECATIIADSRVTWIYPNGKAVRRDLGRKIYPLGERSVISFAGDLGFAGEFIDAMQAAVDRDHRMGEIEFALRHIQRFAEQFIYRYLANRGGPVPPTTIVLAGVSIDTVPSGDCELPRSRLVGSVSMRGNGEAILTIGGRPGSIICVGSGAHKFPYTSIGELAKAFPKDEFIQLVVHPDFRGFAKFRSRPIENFLQNLLKDCADSSIGGLVQRATIVPEGVTYGSTWTVRDEDVVFLHGFDGDAWTAVDRENREVFRLLGCDETLRIRGRDIKEALLV